LGDREWGVVEDEEDEEASLNGDKRNNFDLSIFDEETGGKKEEIESFNYSKEAEECTLNQVCQDSKSSERSESYDRRSIARIFMQGMTGDGENLPYRDQVEVVAGFFEQPSANKVDTEGSGTEKDILILLDDRTHGSGIAKTEEKRQFYRGPLTPKQLKENLYRPVRLLPAISLRLSPLRLTTHSAS
jgi:hypothetical protein